MVAAAFYLYREILQASKILIFGGILNEMISNLIIPPNIPLFLFYFLIFCRLNLFDLI